MDFQPPDATDFANVTALNRAFVDAIGRQRIGPVTGLRDPLAAAVAALDAAERRRLCACPFLLFALAEHDVVRWRRLFDGRSEPDLISQAAQPSTVEARIVAATIGFLWQLAGRRPYAARVVSGASLDWCSRLSDCTLLDCLEFATTEVGLLSVRLHDHPSFWPRLLRAGTRADAKLRRAAHMSALQVLLTGQRESRRSLPAAACALPSPALRVADPARVSKEATREYNTPLDESAVDKKSHQNLRKR